MGRLPWAPDGGLRDSMVSTGQTVIYGGSFNPPHMGHQMACLYLIEALGADQVWMLPAWVHPFGKVLEDFDHRVRMCRKLAAPLGERVRVSEVEREVGGGGRTFDTLQHLIAAEPDRRFALAVGTDILEETHAWHRWQDIQQMVEIVVIGRQGFGPPVGGGLTLPEVSSSEIRARVARGGPITGMVPTAVADHIATHQLYRGTAT